MFSTLAQLQRLDALLQDYVSAAVGVRLLGPSLSDLYKYSQHRGDQGRLVAAFVNLQLGSALLASDFVGPDGVHRSLTGRRSRRSRSPLSTSAEFAETIRWYAALNAFILRYRAQWDKIMGCLILMYHPESYERLLKADSRKKKFRKLAESFPPGAVDIVTIIDQQITEFDEGFRTPEAHGSGSIRKWVFSPEAAFETRQVDLIEYWNLLGLTMDRIAHAIRTGS